MVRGAKGRWGVKGHLQNDSYQAMYMHHDNVVDYLEKYDIYACLSSICFEIFFFQNMGNIALVVLTIKQKLLVKII